MLADYVLALLRHDGSVDDVRKLCETEIPDFLKEGALLPSSSAFLSLPACPSRLLEPSRADRAAPPRAMQTRPCL